MPALDIAVLIPESTRKARGGTSDTREVDAIAHALPPDARGKLDALRQEILGMSPKGALHAGGLLPAYERFDGNMYRSIPHDAWEGRSPGVEVVIASGLRGLLASRDPIPSYTHSMAETMPPVGKLNRWWHDRGLPEILAAYLRAVRPNVVVDLLSLEYREAVIGYAGDLGSIPVRTIDFPGMGRASQPRRGEKVAEILRTGKA